MEKKCFLMDRQTIPKESHISLKIILLEIQPSYAEQTNLFMNSRTSGQEGSASR